MPRSIPATIAANKANLGQDTSYIILVELVIDGLKSLAYDAQSASFNVGRKLTGGSSGAWAKIIHDDDNGVTGTLTLWDVWDHFDDNENITDDGSSPGGATANGSEASDTQTYRFARNPEDVSWNSLTWTKAGIELDVSAQNVEGKEETVTLLVENSSQTLCRYVDSTDGISGSTVKIYVVSSEHLAETYILCEEFVVRTAGHEGGGTWIALSLGKNEAWDRQLPPKSYQWGPCMHQFKETNTCQYSGSDTTCARTMTACIAKDNEDHFGAFPGIPGGLF